MSKLPSDFSGQDMIKFLQSEGFTFVRERGSHVVMRRPMPDNKDIVTVVPDHPELAKGTISGILKQAQISRNEFLRAL